MKRSPAKIDLWNRLVVIVPDIYLGMSFSFLLLLIVIGLRAMFSFKKCVRYVIGLYTT